MDKEQEIKKYADTRMEEGRSLRNNWLRGLAERRGLTEKDYLRMVINADVEAKASGNLPTVKEAIGQEYRQWLKEMGYDSGK